MKKLLLSVGIIFCFTHLVFSQPLGIFTDQGSVGDDSGSGQASFANGTYEILASGSDIWGSADGFYWIYRQVTGDFTVTATVEWGNPEGDFWKKAGIMARGAVADPTDPGAVHVTAALIRDLFNNLFTRKTHAGSSVDDVDGSGEDISGYTNTIRLVREGRIFTMFRGLAAGGFQEVGAVIMSNLPDTILVGLAVTSHDLNTLEDAYFSNVEITGGGTPVEEWFLH
jgi:hypothetical protein